MRYGELGGGHGGGMVASARAGEPLVVRRRHRNVLPRGLRDFLESHSFSAKLKKKRKIIDNELHLKKKKKISMSAQCTAGLDLVYGAITRYVRK